MRMMKRKLFVNLTQRTIVLCLMAMLVSVSAWADRAKPSTTLPIEGEVVKASHPLILYIGRVSFAKNPDVASFNFPGTTIQAAFEGTSLKMVCRPMTGYFMAQVDDVNLSRWDSTPNVTQW